MKYCSFNVNSIRAIQEKMDLNEVFSKLDLDVIGIEETKMSTDDSDKFPLKMDGYHFYETISKVKKGYSGVAVFSKKEPLSVHYGLIDGKYDENERIYREDFGDGFTDAIGSGNQIVWDINQQSKEIKGFYARDLSGIYVSKNNSLKFITKNNQVVEQTYQYNKKIAC